MKKIIFYLFVFLLVALLGSQSIYAETYQRWVAIKDLTYTPTSGFLADMTLALMNGEIMANQPYVVDGETITIAHPDIYLQYIEMCVKSGEPSIITDEDVINAIANGDVVKWGDDINCKVKNYYYSTAHNEVRFNGNYSGAVEGVDVLLINGKPKIKARCGNPLQPYDEGYIPKYTQAVKVPDTIRQVIVDSHITYDTTFKTVLLEEKEVPQEQYPATFASYHQYQQPMYTPMMMPYIPVFIPVPMDCYGHGGNYGSSSNNIDININNTNTNTNTNTNNDRGHYHHDRGNNQNGRGGDPPSPPAPNQGVDPQNGGRGIDPDKTMSSVRNGKTSSPDYSRRSSTAERASSTQPQRTQSQQQTLSSDNRTTSAPSRSSGSSGGGRSYNTAPTSRSYGSSGGGRSYNTAPTSRSSGFSNSIRAYTAPTSRSSGFSNSSRAYTAPTSRSSGFSNSSRAYTAPTSRSSGFSGGGMRNSGGRR